MKMKVLHLAPLAALLLLPLPARAQDRLVSNDVPACSSCQDGTPTGGAGGGVRHRAQSAKNPHGYPNAVAVFNHMGVWAAKESLKYPWHCNYYNMQWGTPVALLVPPTAERSYNMGWGVGNTRLTRNWHQFQRPYPGNGTEGTQRSFQATPPWPSDTSQFGVYYVRGPW
ncbi:MAG: hypothetical protein GTO53_10295 [Planctomycetales bacterium]|nr:hypothetical protein [Planctomycetales bacterium]NIM09510.1 hypothetical protein [Planctomycetales bacterium]NIN08998.1 hypothetical protein [Planctomycetales bacterium]NIN78113.1 hypothetical protein [Planctomycetales bacterium]NIP05176.1 hypothetical protein [Planctomycetales bacterium]